MNIKLSTLKGSLP